MVDPERLRVVGSRFHRHELKQQLNQVFPDFPSRNLLLEPFGRNTAPAILWGLFQMHEADSNEPLFILPADHLIRDVENFMRAVRDAQTLASSGYIVTFGIHPDCPETGYGYLKAAEPLEVGFLLERFVEKPDEHTAKQYLESGNYTWNSGIFMASMETLMHEFRTHAPAMTRVFQDAKDRGLDFQDESVVTDIYTAVEDLSFDYAVMEHSRHAAVLPVDMEWSDLGSWESIFRVSEKDDQGNVLRGNVITRDTRNSLIFSTKKLVTSIGVEGLIIVETEDALLVCDLKRSQDVKQLVETLKEEDRHEYRFHTRVLRPWGHATTIRETAQYRIRVIEISPGRALTRQRHRHRSEHWVVTRGTADVHIGRERKLLNENESIYIPKTVIHRLGNGGRIPLQVIEVQHGAYLGDNDIERFKDDES